MYENITYEALLNRMLDRVPNNLDKRESSIAYDAIAPAAMELKLMYIEFDQILNEAFGDTASRDFLIRRCRERGIAPYEATNAILQGEFTPANIDLIGQRFSLGKLNYVVTSKIEDGKYQVQCETAGAEGNRYLGEIIPIDYIRGLETSALTNLLIPAEDKEETEHLRQRYFDSFGEKAFGGNRRDYINKVTSIAGVGAAKVIPVWNGAGTVKVIIIDSDFNKANDELVKAVQNELDPTQDGTGYGTAPIGHIVTVESVTETEVNVKTALTFLEGYSWDNCKDAIDKAVSDYLKELRQKWSAEENLTVQIFQIVSRIGSINGIKDIDIQNTAINGLNANLTLSEYEIPVYGGVSE